MSVTIKRWKLTRVTRMGRKEHRHVGTREKRAVKDEQRDVNQSRQ